MVLYSAVSSPLDRSKHFTLHPPGRPVHSGTNSTSLGSIQPCSNYCNYSLTFPPLSLARYSFIQRVRHSTTELPRSICHENTNIRSEYHINCQFILTLMRLNRTLPAASIMSANRPCLPTLFETVLAIRDHQGKSHPCMIILAEATGCLLRHLPSCTFSTTAIIHLQTRFYNKKTELTRDRNETCQLAAVRAILMVLRWKKHRKGCQGTKV